MTINDYRKFRESIFKNCKSLYFADCDMYCTSETFFEEDKIKPENKGYYVRHLYDTFCISKYHYNEEYRKVVDTEYHLTVDEEGVDFYIKNRDKQRFDHVSSREFCDEVNRTVFMMEIATKVANIANGRDFWS